MHVSEKHGEFVDHLRRCSHIFLWVEDAVDGQAYGLSHLRHNLHQAAGSRPGDGIGVETRLLITDGSQEPPVEIGGIGVFLEEVVPFRDNAFILVEERGIDMSLTAKAGKVFLLHLLHLREHLGLEPGVDAVGQLPVVVHHRPTRLVDLGSAEDEAVGSRHFLAEGSDNEVAHTLAQVLHHFQGIETLHHLYPHAEIMGQLGGHEVLHTQFRPVCRGEIGVLSRNRDDPDSTTLKYLG